MRKIPRCAAAVSRRLSKRQIAASLGIGPTAAGGFACAGRVRPVSSCHWPDDLGDAALDAACIGACGRGQGLAVAAGLAGGSSRVAPQGRDAAMVWRSTAPPIRRLQPQPVLRTVSRLGGRLSPTMRSARGRARSCSSIMPHDDRQIFDATTGEVHACQLFVAALGASSYTYAEATATQSLPTGSDRHTRVRLFRRRAGDGVSDNLKSGITKPASTSPPSIAPMPRWGALQHGDRAGAAQEAGDKAKVEVAVQVATRLDHRQAQEPPVFSLPELTRRSGSAS